MSMNCHVPPSIRVSERITASGLYSSNIPLVLDFIFEIVFEFTPWLTNFTALCVTLSLPAFSAGWGNHD